jgi:hypothetical protein
MTGALAADGDNESTSPKRPNAAEGGER